MAHQAPARAEIPTKSPQLRLFTPAETHSLPRRGRGGTVTPILSGGLRNGNRSDDRVVLEVGYGITVYPPLEEGGRWWAVWQEDGKRCQTESVREDKLAADLEKVKERLASGAGFLQRPGADLIAWYLSPDRRKPRGKPWSRRHADTQRRLCERFVTPVIATTTCQDITVSQTQKIVNAPSTQGEGDRMHRCLSAVVNAGLAAGYLLNPRLKDEYGPAAGLPVHVLEPVSPWVCLAQVSCGHRSFSPHTRGFPRIVAYGRLSQILAGTDGEPLRGDRGWVQVSSGEVRAGDA